MITLARFRRLERAVQDAGHHDDTDWSESLIGPASAEQFAKAAVYVIVNSGMKYAVAQDIYARCIGALLLQGHVGNAFGHPGKVKAIDAIWLDRERLFSEYRGADDILQFCQSLPWIGPITKYHLAKDLGLDVAKPDLHLARLARGDRTTVERLCARLSRQTGYRVATVDTILWRACATGILSSLRYEAEGWRAAFRGTPITAH